MMDTILQNSEERKRICKLEEENVKLFEELKSLKEISQDHKLDLKETYDKLFFNLNNYQLH